MGKFASGDWLPECASIRYRPEVPEVYFRVVHNARQGQNGQVAGLQEQEVEIALGPKGAFQNGNIGVLKRKMPVDHVAVSGAPPPRGKPKPPREPKTPRIAELLCKAIKWRQELDSGTVTTQAEIARQEGITRARVTQVLSLLNLAPEIQEHIRNLPEMARRPEITERTLRPIAQLKDIEGQMTKFEHLFERDL